GGRGTGGRRPRRRTRADPAGGKAAVPRRREAQPLAAGARRGGLHRGEIVVAGDHQPRSSRHEELGGGPAGRRDRPDLQNAPADEEALGEDVAWEQLTDAQAAEGEVQGRRSRPRGYTGVQETLMSSTSDSLARRAGRAFTRVL